MTCSKATYAQCSHVLEHKATLDQLLKAVPSIHAKNQGLLYVLLYELLLGPNQRIRGGGAVKRQLMAHEETLKRKLKTIQESRPNGTSKNDQKALPSPIIPRYVRINTLVADPTSLLKELCQKIHPIYMDPHVPDLLVVAPTPENRALLQEYVTSHRILLQDKSSCFSALCLVHGFDNDNNDSVGFDCLDACAAPGNKTSHLAALVQRQTQHSDGGKNRARRKSIVHALDKAPDRFKLLKRRVSELVPDLSVLCYNLDFLETSPSGKAGQKHKKENNMNDSSFENVRAILLDPSCSGSGMTTNHTEHSLNRDPYHMDDRIRSLSDFQFRALEHATSKFPLVDRVVYSTCSRYYQENEGVVKRLLDAADGKWELIAPHCLKQWHRRGLLARDEHNKGLTEDQAKCLIRVDPDHDATNGFFVACLQRTGSFPSKSKHSSTWKSPKETCPQGMELYNNQFHELSGKTSSQESPVRPNANKRKAADNDSTSEPTTISAHSKKRAKKMGWKRQQRLKKEKRLKQKNEQLEKLSAEK